jgi:hypothetical protein
LVDSKKKVKKLKQKLLATESSKKVDDKPKEEKEIKKEHIETTEEFFSHIRQEHINIEKLVTDISNIELQETPVDVEQEISQLEKLAHLQPQKETKQNIESSYLGIAKQEDTPKYALVDQWDPTQYPHIDSPKDESTNLLKFNPDSDEEETKPYVQPKYH